MRRSAKPGIAVPATGPRAYLITFAGYGTWLHGDEDGSVDRQHNVYGLAVCKPDSGREKLEHLRMKKSAFVMSDAAQRVTVLSAIGEVCEQRGWWLFAAHVRTSHVHAIVQAGDPPEKVMNDFKAYASRRLNELARCAGNRWARHGSTRRLWNQEQVNHAIHYVLHEQGEPMAVYAAPGVCKQ